MFARFQCILLFGLALFLAGCGGSSSTITSPPQTACSTNYATPNYAHEIDPTRQVKNELRYWTSFPLRIYVKNSLAQTFDTNTYTTSDTINAALQRWIDASNGQIQFILTTDPDNHDISLEFTPTPTRPGSGETLGETIVTYLPTSSQLLSAELTINYWPGMTQDEFTQGLQATLTHEIGHALFLQGHSSDPEDNMYSIIDPSKDKPLTQKDINTFLTAYCGNFQTKTPSNRTAPQEQPLQQTITCRH